MTLRRLASLADDQKKNWEKRLMTTVNEIIPFSLRDAPALIESVLPVQRISVESYKEQMANTGKALTALGSYWKGRKPLVLNRACVLGALLPATSNTKKDLEVFELLMAMDDESIRKRLGAETPPAQGTYREKVSKAKRQEEMDNSLNSHIWSTVNEHLGTRANSFPELVEQLGIMRFGERPIVADTFSGSGQIPYEAARLGCNVLAADLNPVACMLTWGAFNVVGANDEVRKAQAKEQKELIARVRNQIDELGVETDGKGWRARIFLYCLEVTCPSSGWKVPVLPSLIISQDKGIVAELVPVTKTKSYEIRLNVGVSDAELQRAKTGTYQSQSVVHKVGNTEHRNKISSIRGDYVAQNNGQKETRNQLRAWTSEDIQFSPNDLYNERLYAVLWVKDDGSPRPETEFRAVTDADLKRERTVSDYVSARLAEWQANGWVPDMRIESGDETERLYRERGWTHWHHLFNPRQLLINGLLNQQALAANAISIAQLVNYNSKLSIWHSAKGQGFGSISQVFYNQALNTIFNYGCRGSESAFERIKKPIKSVPVFKESKITIRNSAAEELTDVSHIYITDPPYGDAVKYEEIYEYFISWFRSNPPEEFSSWVWDSRRAMAIKGEDHDFKLGMVAAYKRMAEKMPDNGLQVIMFTHQSGAIWADMANIVWASGLRVTAAWYVVTETDSALREGQYVKGTILLVLRKRLQEIDTARDELAYELAEEVKAQVDLLTGLNKNVRDLYRDENLFEDADLQMAGYAAALRVLTRYSQIDGVSMMQESMRPRVKGQTTMVDDLIAFAVNIANEYLVPEGVDRTVWEKSSGIERFYLKMLDMESKGIHVLSNYQNFAKAFKVQDYGAVMDEVKANHASLKSAEQLGKRGMTASDEFGPTVLRSVLYAVHLLQENKVKPEDVLHQLRDLVPDYFRERERITALADYVSKKTAKARPDESSNAVVLRDLVRRERV
jgi:putative DNA methylase